MTTLYGIRNGELTTSKTCNRDAVLKAIEADGHAWGVADGDGKLLTINRSVELANAWAESGWKKNMSYGQPDPEGLTVVKVYAGKRAAEAACEPVCEPVGTETTTMTDTARTTVRPPLMREDEMYRVIRLSPRHTAGEPQPLDTEPFSYSDSHYIGLLLYDRHGIKFTTVRSERVKGGYAVGIREGDLIQWVIGTELN